MEGGLQREETERTERENSTTLEDEGQARDISRPVEGLDTEGRVQLQMRARAMIVRELGHGERSYSMYHGLYLDTQDDGNEGWVAPLSRRSRSFHSISGVWLQYTIFYPGRPGDRRIIPRVEDVWPVSILRESMMAFLSLPSSLLLLRPQRSTAPPWTQALWSSPRRSGPC